MTQTAGESSIIIIIRETWGLADNYDLCLDECKLGIDGVAAVVSAYIGQIDGKD